MDSTILQGLRDSLPIFFTQDARISLTVVGIKQGEIYSTWSDPPSARYLGAHISISPWYCEVIKTQEFSLNPRGGSDKTAHSFVSPLDSESVQKFIRNTLVELRLIPPLPQPPVELRLIPPLPQSPDDDPHLMFCGTVNPLKEFNPYLPLSFLDIIKGLVGNWKDDIVTYRDKAEYLKLLPHYIQPGNVEEIKSRPIDAQLEACVDALEASYRVKFQEATDLLSDLKDIYYEMYHKNVFSTSFDNKEFPQWIEMRSLDSFEEYQELRCQYDKALKTKKEECDHWAAQPYPRLTGKTPKLSFNPVPPASLEALLNKMKEYTLLTEFNKRQALQKMKRGARLDYNEIGYMITVPLEYQNDFNLELLFLFLTKKPARVFSSWKISDVTITTDKMRLTFIATFLGMTTTSGGAAATVADTSL